MVCLFSMPLQLLGVKVHLAQVAGGVTLGLIVEVLRLDVAAFAAGGDRAGVDLVAELDAGDEAVAARAVPFLGVLVGACAE